jgi:V/A-type H+-transporting ATPase subunit C
MSEAISEVYDVFSRTRDPQAIDLILDRASPVSRRWI